MIKLEIVVGESFFTPGLMCAGVALQGDTVKARVWADAQKVGRPASVESTDRNHTVEWCAEYLRKRWTKWVEDNNIEATIKPGFRKISSQF